MTVSTIPATTPPTTANTQNAAAVNNGLAQVADNFQTFLTLLTTQLKNQDPLSPLDTNQFTQQLTEMTGVEQQLLSNKLLQQLVTQNQGGGITAGVGLIGKTITASGTTATLENGAATWEFAPASPPASMTASVFDAGNNLVWTGALAPNGAARADETGSVGETDDMAAGTTKDLTVNLPAGHYVLLCNLPGHYMGGMRVGFTVR